MEDSKRDWRAIGYFILLLAVCSLFINKWQIEQRRMLAGDEPHYLVVASGIAHHATLEQTVPYQEEFQHRTIARWHYPEGLGPRGQAPNPGNSHTKQGPNGLYSIHSIGFPALLALPYKIGDLKGARLAVMLMCLLVIVYTWKFARLYSATPGTAFTVAVVSGLSLNLLPASNQIFPDIAAGLFCLAALYWLLSATRQRIFPVTLLYFALVAYLPWLHIKFAAAALVLVIAMGVRLHLDDRKPRYLLSLVGLTCLSALMLAFYNYYAFGTLRGPYEGGSLVVNAESFMVLLGLHFDQNQGFMLQNPALFFGLFGTGLLFCRDRLGFVAFLFVYAAVMVPNAMHPNWYGGFSLSGRFNLTAAIVFLVPASLAMCLLASRARYLWYAVAVACVALQLWLYSIYTFEELDMRNRYARDPEGRFWVDSYSTLYSGVAEWLPAFYNVHWSYSYLPNYAVVLLALCLLVAGFSYGLNPGRFGRRTWIGFSTVLLGILVINMLWSRAPDAPIAYAGSELLLDTGTNDGTSRIARAGEHPPGLLTYGPRLFLYDRDYVLTIRYSSSAPADQEVATWSWVSPVLEQEIASGVMRGTDGEVVEVVVRGRPEHAFPSKYEVFTAWQGKADLRIDGIEIGKWDGAAGR